MAQVVIVRVGTVTVTFAKTLLLANNAIARSENIFFDLPIVVIGAAAHKKNQLPRAALVLGLHHKRK